MNQIVAQDNLALLIGIIKEIKPSLADANITPSDTVTESLGLDSLDILQLVRKIRRASGADFDLDAWSEDKVKHRGSIQSILDIINISLVD
jgi:acyl carrier protein